MKRPLLTKFAAIAVASVPLSAFAGYSVASTASTQISVTMGLLAASGFLAARKKRPLTRAQNATRLLNEHINAAEARWKHNRDIKIDSEDLESALCSFRSYMEMESAVTLVEVIRSGASSPVATGQVMLDRASQIFPAAYAAFDLRGKENQTTLIAREIFKDIVHGMMRDIALQCGPSRVDSVDTNAETEIVRCF